MLNGKARRQRILICVREYLHAHAIPPTFDEIGRATGMAKSLVRHHVGILVNESKLVRLSSAQAARNITTLRNWRQRDPDLNQDVRRAMEFARSDAVDYGKWALNA